MEFNLKCFNILNYITYNKKMEYDIYNHTNNFKYACY